MALCDNGPVRWGGRGDGERLAANLCWATRGGLVGWFRRPGSPWREVLRLMDLTQDEVEAVLRAPRAARPQAKGWVAVACRSVDYVAGLADAARVPLLLTADLLFAGSHSFAGAVRALASGAPLGAIRDAAIAAYAEGQEKAPRRVRPRFTTPADPRWPDLLRRAAPWGTP